MDVIAALSGWSASSGPLHRSLAAALARAIARGEVPGGTRLPSERVLARRLVVSRSTVVAAYDALARQGLVTSRRGSGTYVTAAPARRRWEEPTATAPILRPVLEDDDGLGADMVSLGSAAVPPTTALRGAMSAAVDEDLPRLIERPGYQPLGLPSLRRAVAEVMCAAGVTTTPSQILVTTGAHQALHLCAAILVRPGDWVAIEDPSYSGCIDAFATAGARLVPVEVDDEGLVPESLERVLTERTVAAVCVTPTFHTPTGTLLSHSRRRRVAELAARHRVPIVEDQVLLHARLSDIEVPPPMAAYAAGLDVPVLSVGSASKVFWTGLRTGWIRADDPWLTRLARRKAAVDLGSAVLDQAVTARLLGELPQIAEALRTQLAGRLEVCERSLAGFQGWAWRQPSGGASLWVELGTDAARFAQVALRHGVEVIPGTAFSVSGRWNSHIRLPFALERSVMDEALNRLRAAWAAYRPGAALDSPAEDRVLVV